jgi:hypothetical protein
MNESAIAAAAEIEIEAIRALAYHLNLVGDMITAAFRAMVDYVRTMARALSEAFRPLHRWLVANGYIEDTEPPLSWTWGTSPLTVRVLAGASIPARYNRYPDRRSFPVYRYR